MTYEKLLSFQIIDQKGKKRRNLVRGKGKGILEGITLDTEDSVSAKARDKRV